MSGASAAAVAHTVHILKKAEKGHGSQRAVRVRDDGGAGEANHAFLDPSLAGRDLPSDLAHTSGFVAGTVVVINCTRTCRTQSPKAAARKGAAGQNSDSDAGACRWRAVCGACRPMGGPATIAGKN